MKTAPAGRSTAAMIALGFLALAICAFIGGPARAKPGWTAMPDGKQTIEIDIENKQYVLPDRTLVIPPEFKQQGVRFAVRSGDTIKICNNDTVYMKPFSASRLSTFNAIGPARGLSPGQCVSYVVKHNGDDIAPYNLFDQIHARNKVFMIVVPESYPRGGEPTPPDTRDFIDPREEYPLSPDGEIIPGQKSEWTGSWKSADGTSNTAISGGGGTLTATEQWASGGRHGTNNWKNCKVQGATATCDWDGVYEGDPAKDGARHGTVTVTLSADSQHITGSYLEGPPNFINADGTPFTGDSAMHDGAVWPIDFTRQ